MPAFQTDVNFVLGAGMERDIICGGPVDAAGRVPEVLRQGAYFPTMLGDVTDWLIIKPGSVRMIMGEVYATLQFGGTTGSFEKRCLKKEVATLYLSSTQAFTVTVRFS